MTDSQDSNDEIHSMSQRFQAATTIETIADSIPGSNIIATCSSGAQSAAKLMNQVTTEMEIGGGITSQLTCRLDKGRQNFTTLESELSDEPVRDLPELNLPENITLIVDVTKEENCTEFKLGNGSVYMPMYMIKRVVEIFVGAKSMINKNHKFAVVALSVDSIKWLCDYTSNVKTVLTALDSLSDEHLDEEDTSFDLSEFFEALHGHISLPTERDSGDPPSHVSRAVLIYSRSNCIPRFQNGKKYFELLSDNPYFVLDCLYVHEPPSQDNKCEDVYTELTALDAKNFSYILEVGRNATKLHDNMAKLLAHPLQRPLQKNACYTVQIPGAAATTAAVEEVQTNV